MLMRSILVAMVAGFVCVFVFVLASCSGSKVSKEYADKINSSYEAGTALTYEVVKEELGNECIDITTSKNGVLVAIKGVSNQEYKEKLNGTDTNTKYDYIVITVVQEQCQHALFATGPAIDINGALINAK